MKIFKYFILLAFVSICYTSCELADPIESQITEYAEFEMEGGPYLYVDQGTNFQDPGVTAIAGGNELEVNVSGTVDTSTPGVYVLTYSAVNEDGFPASTTRYVAVGNKEVAFGRNLSGSYFTNGRLNTVTQIQPGFYLNSDTLPNNSISVFMIDLGNGMLIIPPQESRFGTILADPTRVEGSSAQLLEDGSIRIAQYISCCGIFTRTFTK